MEEKRKSKRFRIPAPAIVTMGSREVWAFTRDISTQAAYFRTAGEDDRPALGERLEFVIKVPSSIGLSSSRCIKGWGYIHRVDDLAGHETGVVVEIVDFRIELETEHPWP